MKLLKNVAYAFALTALACSCSDEIEPSNGSSGTNNVITMAVDDIQIKDGMMVFGSSKVLEQTVNDLNTASITASTKSLSRTNFRSQQEIFHQIVIEEDSLDERLSRLPKKEIKSLDVNMTHSDIYLEMRDKGIIREYEEDGGISYDYAICDPTLASIVNEDGFFAVADTVFYLDADKIVRWENANFRNLNKMKSAYQTDSTANIYVFNSKVLTKGTPADEKYAEIHYKDAFNGKKKYTLTLHFQIDNLMKLGTDCMKMSYRYYVSVKSKTKKVFGGYKYRTCYQEYTSSSSASAKVYRTSQPSSLINAQPGSTSKDFKGNYENVFVPLSFYSPVANQQWESVCELFFNIGPEKVAIESATTNPSISVKFENTKTVDMYATVSVYPKRSTPVDVTNKN